MGIMSMSNCVIASAASCLRFFTTSIPSRLTSMTARLLFKFCSRIFIRALIELAEPGLEGTRNTPPLLADIGGRWLIADCGRPPDVIDRAADWGLMPDATDADRAPLEAAAEGGRPLEAAADGGRPYEDVAAADAGRAAMPRAPTGADDGRDAPNPCPAA